MRYIRTKETDYGCIIDTVKYKEITGEECFIPKDEIVAEADTIEALCDEFIIIGTYEKKLTKFNVAKYNRVLNKNLKIYGAVWTDKGLIYVAKMNEKGELELL